MLGIVVDNVYFYARQLTKTKGGHSDSRVTANWMHWLSLVHSLISEGDM
jgi:hypothetical protein